MNPPRSPPDSARSPPPPHPSLGNLSFGIIGGGWYGCHVASSLRALGFRVRVFEQHGRLMHEASGNNQFRLHTGFHYARHRGTRVQSRDGFLRFIERYPGLSRAVPCNLYAVASRDSLVDYGTWNTIMASSGLHFTEGAGGVMSGSSSSNSISISINSSSSSGGSVVMSNVSGVVRTAERVLLLTKARHYFEAELEGVLSLGHKVSRVEEHGDETVSIDGEPFDFVIDATWGHYGRPPDVEVVYEPTLLLYYEGPHDFPAITLVDGPLCSVYPTEAPGLFTLSSVPYTPLGQFKTAEEARAVRDGIDAGAIRAKRKLMEDQISHYLPAFRRLFRYVGPQLAVKTKAVGAHADRSCQVHRRGRVFSIMSGKIDTVFYATERILSMIEAPRVPVVSNTLSSLRQDLAMLSSRAHQKELLETVTEG